LAAARGFFVMATSQMAIHASMNGHLATANQSEIRKAYLVSVEICATIVL